MVMVRSQRPSGYMVSYPEISIDMVHMMIIDGWMNKVINKNKEGGRYILSYPPPTPRPLMTASQFSSSSSRTGPRRSMPCSLADSDFVHVSSSLRRRRIALREDDEPEEELLDGGMVPVFFCLCCAVVCCFRVLSAVVVVNEIRQTAPPRG
jgi:hypothetical protein